MSYTVAEGPPDLEATHSWSSGGPFINDKGSTFPPTCPYVRLDRITGWRALPEADDFRDPRTSADGEIVYPGRLLGKTIVYEGRAMARSLATMRSTISGLTYAFGANMVNEGTMTVTPFAWVGGPTWTFKARCTAFTPDGDFDYLPTLYIPFRHGFQLTLRMSDPRFYTGGSGHL